MKKLLIPIMLLMVIGFSAFAQDKSSKVQNKSSKEKRGDKYFFVYSFDKAIDAYTHAKKLSLDGERKLAASYHNTDQNLQSEETYSKILSAPEGILPEDYYNYAMVLKTDGKYLEAGKQMDKFNQLKPEDLRAKDYSSNNLELANLSKEDGRATINHLNMNTDAEDFGTSYYKNAIIFASSGANPQPNEKLYNWNRKPFLDMYVSEIGENQLKTPAIFDKSLDGKMHDGPASFSNEGTFMAFTRNYYDLKKKDKVVRVQICFSSFKDGKWSEAESFVHNSKEYSCGHPCLTSDGKTMYFTCDMQGGLGGADIYRITKDEKGTWGKVENLGNKINTEGDELFPFYEEKNQVLFFASNGHFGLGGLDIFVCAIDGSKSGHVYNAGFPLNSQNDDFAVIVDGNLKTGYFSSNRTGGSGDDDIYSVNILKLEIGKKIEGIAKEKNGNAIPKATVTLLDENGFLVDSVTTKEDGSYSFLVESNKNFKLIGKKENYLDGTNVASTFGKEFIVKADVMLLRKEEIVAKIKEVEKTKVEVDLGPIMELKPIYFDLDKFNIRPDAADELAKIVKVMNGFPEMTVELNAYTDCRASKGYNQVLSDKRAKASADYIKARISKPARIYGKGYGETKLKSGCACEDEIISTCSDGEFQSDRRTEFIIVKKPVITQLPLTNNQ